MPRIIAMRSSGDIDCAAAMSCGVGPSGAFELARGASGANWARRAATNLRHGASAGASASSACSVVLAAAVSPRCSASSAP